MLHLPSNFLDTHRRLTEVIEFVHSDFARSIPPDKIRPCDLSRFLELVDDHAANQVDTSVVQHNSLAMQFDSMLRYLAEYANGPGCMYDRAEGKNTRCTLYPDSAPFSFSYVMECSDSGDGTTQWQPWYNGGLIYHGPLPENMAELPTWTVSLSGGIGWGSHT